MVPVLVFTVSPIGRAVAKKVTGVLLALMV